MGLPLQAALVQNCYLPNSFLNRAACEHFDMSALDTATEQSTELS